MNRQAGVGHEIWAIAEGYIPEWSNGPQPQMVSHEILCFLNTSDSDAHITLFIYHPEEEEPSGPYRLIAHPRRTLHQRLNDLKDPQPIQKGSDYACLIESDVPIVVQHTRLDSRQAENAIISTIAFHGD